MPRTKSMKPTTYGIEDEVAAAAEAARAIEFIEKHLFDDLSLVRIARACGASPWHFSRNFSRRSGESVMSYVRGRRLDVAATRLVREPKTALVDIALDGCFGSQAAFTRAFTRAFGMSPERYRRSDQPGGRKRRNSMTHAPVLEVTVEHIDTFQVVGLSGRFDPSTYLQVSKLWAAFVGKARAAGHVDGETCGVFRDRNFVAQSFEHLAGARLAAGAQPTAGLEVWTLPARKYLVFKQHLVEGELHPQVAAAGAEIWGKRVPQSGHVLARAPDFQIYPANFKVGPGGWIKYGIPIE